MESEQAVRGSRVSCSNVNVRKKRWAGIVLLVSLVSAATLGVPVIRRSILRAAGWALVVNGRVERVEPVDIIVISFDAEGAGALEAADLLHSGVASRVAVFTDAPDTVSREFVRRGVPYEGLAARSVRQLRALGIDAVGQIPKSVAGTKDEGPALADWCDRQGFRSVVIVTTSDHSRRLRRVLNRSMKGHQTRVIIRPARYTDFDPERWWETRSGIRTEIEELEKLLLDVVRHPIS